ncbi:hypothetical protein BLS_004173 [Venturia inaequalis]|uniref:5-formyltetrahydrofolate cyclo-ligase n=1 Tax=Venturia inaequalis TaxID=5025 RepID=A0A8H3UBF1_VENIN|nr:hypothetical protein EG328_008443 [Venturia inaequalis]KAE9972127.1 hypothetical protein BLS_004173 [Venturia inaequalis]
MSTTRLAKRELRKHLKKILATIPNESVTEQTNTILSTLLTIPEYTSSKTISIYLSMPTAEVQTSFLVKDALENGKRVFIPYCYKRSMKTTPSNQPAQPSQSNEAGKIGELEKISQPGQIMDMLELKDVQDYERLKLDSWGIPTPSSDTLGKRRNCFGGYGKSEDLNIEEADTEDELDLIITPGLGFDRSLGRIGRGMGFYDRFFEKCAKFSRSGKVPWKVGLALDEQVLPADQTVPMDETDQRIDALILGDGSVLRR